MWVRPQKQGNCLGHKIWERRLTSVQNLFHGLTSYKAGSLTLNSTSKKSWSNTTKAELVGISRFTRLPSSFLPFPVRLLFVHSGSILMLASPSSCAVVEWLGTSSSRAHSSVWYLLSSTHRKGSHYPRCFKGACSPVPCDPSVHG